MRLNLQRRITAAFLLPTVLLLGLFASLALSFIHSAQQTQQHHAATLAAAELATTLTSLLQTAIIHANNTAALAMLRPDLPDADFLAMLRTQLLVSPEVYGAGVTFLPTLQGGQRKDLYVHRKGDQLIDKDQSNTYDGTDGTRDWFSLPQQTGQAVWTPPYFDEGAGEVWMVTYSTPVKRNGVFVGVALADIRLDQLGAALASVARPQQWVLLDAEGRVLYAPQQRHLSRPYTDWAPANTERALFVGNALKGQEIEAELLDWDEGQSLLTGVARIEHQGWILLLGREAAMPLLSGNSRWWLLALLLFSGATLLLLSRLLHRELTPLRELVRHVERLASTPLAQPQALPAVDEVRLLSHGVTALTNQLHARERHLASRQRELADRVREQQVLYRVADILGWADINFTEMLSRVAALLPEAWAHPEQIGCRIDLAEYHSTSEGFRESQRGLFAPIEVDGDTGGVWIFAQDGEQPLEAGQQELLEGVAQQIGLAFRRERGQQLLEKLNRDLEIRVERRTDALRHAERLLRDITNSIPGAVYQMVQKPPRSPELRFVSAGIESVFGVPRDQALANMHSMIGLIYPEDLSELNAVIATAIGRRQPFTHAFRINHAKTGEMRWIRTAANTVPEFSGEVLLNGYWIDITDQKELELALEAARSEANAANEAKSRFLANMSHEIRTPMNAIIGLTHLAVSQTEEPKLHDQLSRVEDNAKALLGLLNDILDFSKIEAGRMTVERIPFDLRDVLDRVQSLISDRAVEKGLTFNVWRVPELPRDLMGDPLRLHQVLLNLVSNAVKFTEAGSVALNCTVEHIVDERAPVQLCFEVVDTGVGIDPVQMTRLFSAFTQADNSTTRRFGGTGLGLTICKELVTLMGGEITVLSMPGSGSTFIVRLTFDRADPSWRDDPLLAIGEVQGDPLPGARVLLVDDNFINLEVAGELLKQAGVCVVTASNGREALEKIATEHFDAVLMDLQMPEMDGLTATQMLRSDAQHANMPIIAMTANAMTGDRERCIAAGMNDHIPKPIDPAELRHTLARWLRRRKLGDLAQTLPPIYPGVPK